MIKDKEKGKKNEWELLSISLISRIWKLGEKVEEGKE